MTGVQGHVQQLHLQQQLQQPHVQKRCVSQPMTCMPRFFCASITVCWLPCCA